MTAPAENTPPKTLPWIWTVLLLAVLPGVALAIYFGGVRHRVDDHPPAVKKKVAGHRQATPAMEPAAMEPAAMEPAAMEPAAMEPAAMEPAPAMKVVRLGPMYPRPPRRLRDLVDPFAMRPAPMKARTP